jgi:phosphoribosylanthranilate isomerase
MPVRIKICGVTRYEDAALAAQLGADAIGLNFHPASPRCVSIQEAAAIVRALPPSVEAVGVFVERSWTEIGEVLHSVPGMQWVQRHGQPPIDVPPAEWRFIPAFPIENESSLEQINRYLDRCGARGRLPDAILVDAHVPGQHGGTGRQPPWGLLAGFQPAVPLILAGGLTPENVTDAIRTVRPYAVDVATGVESRPGIKDPPKMKRFFENARASVG